jgi:hypothetical protein
MENFLRNEDGVWNSKLNPEELKEHQIFADEKIREAEFDNNLNLRRKGRLFENIDNFDDKEHETVSALEEMIHMMKMDPSTDPEVLKKMEEELAEEKEKRETLEKIILEAEDTASLALQNKKNRAN